MNGYYPQVAIGSGMDALRTAFPAGVALTPDGGSAPNALSFIASCKALPANTMATSGLFGHAYLINQATTPAVSGYMHFGAPNTPSCIPSNAEDGSWGGTFAEINPSSAHSAGVNICFTDGAVKFIRNSIAPTAWWAIGTRNGGEVTNTGDY